MPRASIIVATYNRPSTLALGLQAFARQTAGDFELLVADDGSAASTAELLHAVAPALPFSLTHVWQEDRGFRLARILNRAAVRAQADYLIFTDGDCIPRKTFVAEHLANRRRGHFLVGRAVALSARFSCRVGRDYIASGRLDSLNPALLIDGLLGETGLAEHSVRVRPDWLLRLCDRRRPPARLHLVGNNWSGWRDNFLRVNGFDEWFDSWGSEDIELGWRLRNAGLKPLSVKNRAITFHLYHGRGHACPRPENVSRAEATRTGGGRWCERGVDDHLAPRGTGDSQTQPQTQRAPDASGGPATAPRGGDSAIGAVRE